MYLCMETAAIARGVYIYINRGCKRSGFETDSAEIVFVFASYEADMNTDTYVKRIFKFKIRADIQRRRI